MSKSKKALKAENIQNALLKAVLYAIDTDKFLRSFEEKLERCERGVKLLQAGVSEEHWRADVSEFLPEEFRNENGAILFQRFKAKFEEDLHLGDYKWNVRSRIESLAIEFVDLLVGDSSFNEALSQVLKKKFNPQSEPEYRDLVEIQSSKLLKSLERKGLFEEEVVGELDFKINYHEMTLNDLKKRKGDILEARAQRNAPEPTMEVFLVNLDENEVYNPEVLREIRAMRDVYSRESRKYVLSEITPEKAKEMLSFIPWEGVSHGVYMNIYAAVTRCFPEETAKDILSDWCGEEAANKPEYRAAAMNSSVGITTLIYHAVKHGYDKSKLYKPIQE